MNSVFTIMTHIFISTDAVAFSRAHFGAGTGTIYLDNVGCTGSETNLIDCTRSSTVSCFSGHSEDAGVRCQGLEITVHKCYSFCVAEYYLFLHSNFNWQPVYLWRCSSGGRLKSV